MLGPKHPHVCCIFLSACWQRLWALQACARLSAVHARAGERVAMYLGPVPEDKLPKDAAPGRLLTGALALAKKGNSSGEAPGRVPLRYM